MIHPRSVSETRRLPDVCATRIIAFWKWPALNYWPVHVFLLAAIGSFCAVRTYISLMGSNAFTHDAFMTFDGAWRMFNGQRPHVDFYSHLGVLTYAPTVLGFWVAHGTAAGFGYGQALLAFVLGLWSYLLARNRLADLPAVLISLAITLMAVGLSALGFSPFTIAPAMTYNRQAYAILAIILIEAFPENRSDRKVSDFIGGFSSGLAVAFLLFLKITYFVLAVLLLVVFAVVHPQTRRRWAGLTLGFVGVFLVLCMYFRFNLIPMLNDLATVARTKHFRLDWYYIDDIFIQGAALLVVGLSAAALLWRQGETKAARLLAIGTIAVCIAGALLPLGNYELTGFSMGVFLALLIINDTIVRGLYNGASFRPETAMLLLLSSVFVAGFLGVQALEFPYGVAIKLFKAPRFTAFDSPILQTFVPVDGDTDYTAFVNQGFGLLRRYRLPSETVMSLDFTNPFSYGLGIKPAPGGTTVLQYRTTFNDAHRQSAQSLFGHADLVMIPTPGFFSDGSLDYSIRRLYEPYLDRHFALLGQNRFWQLYQRKPA